MATSYIKLSIELSLEKQDMVIAFLSALGFEGFELRDQLVMAYISHDNFKKEDCYQILTHFDICISTVRIETLLEKNWNEEWERQYNPVYIDQFCQIITTFHESQVGYKHTVIINPQMSFGTGHHETTRLMIRQMCGMVFENKIVLEMGSGTGILSILAEKLQAKRIVAIDIDPWSEENTRTNISLNEAKNIDVFLGDVNQIPSCIYDIILANINRNVLIRDIPTYVSFLADDGELVISGFHEKDKNPLMELCRKLQLVPTHIQGEASWSSVRFRKRIC